ncbi:hypothetical protein BLOT_006495 [Blomia tropicalis]|nr:hypothetical protein BLOT_006495 [Blomia tropicalis]
MPKIRFASDEKIRFSENETVYFLCQENQFPHHVQKRVCRHGSWHGPPARCGKAVIANVTKLKAFKCADTQVPILNVDVNLTEEPQFQLPNNAFHFTRVNQNTILSVAGSNCYRWIIKFDRKIEIAFLLIDINVLKMKNVNNTPIINVDITHRVCKLQHNSHQVIDNDEVYGYYFFCDLKSGKGNETEQFNTDYLVMDVHTSINRTVGLEAVFVAETYKKQTKKQSVVDCGKLEIQRTGVLEQIELSYIQVNCNDSFTEPGGIKKHKFTCESNGLWQGTWPVCIPKQTCQTSEIMDNLPSSIVVEQIGNVYYVNDSEWYAIDQTWVRYSCANIESAIMVGKNDRRCMGGKWSNKIPHCTQAIQPSSLNINVAIIGLILLALIIVFSLIVYLSIKFHTKKIHRTLETTKSEIEANALQKQYSHDYYTDIGLETIYEDCKEVYSTPMYELSDDVRYEAEPRALINEPEYLTMTEGIKRPIRPSPNSTSYDYSNY